MPKIVGASTLRMNGTRTLGLWLVACVLGLAGCQSMIRPINPPLKHVDSGGSDEMTRQGQSTAQSGTYVILAFSGGGTRAAAGRIIADSPDFKRLLEDVGGRIVDAPVAAPRDPR